MNNYEFNIHCLFILYLGFTFAQAVKKIHITQIILIL